MNKIVKNTLILSAITIVAGCLLGLVYEITKAPIEQAQENAKQEAYKTVLADAAEFTVDDTLDAAAAANVLQEAGYTGDDIAEVAKALDASGAVMGYVITVTSHEGYGGDIKISVGILSDGTVKGIEMLEISETAGLGMKAAEDDFKNQFKDKQVEKFSYTKSGEDGDDKIDALSGATITTNAVTNAVDCALVYFQNVLGGSAQ
ncbi:RnfABCDGE type electron transport complex subunit G [Schaedlerella arabinosiphila]|uniref:Ion-translocating oxidoreductase complex subunit G n=1 Tax=Schaedlerella arabinosiphila TaxID=2044587 RepID=A0A9X5CBZ4_9FIRM|nr:RnfABCDGE type electron transport complex subunit G [Schaedlerella arabinosiphila]KAI4443924.1 Na(+)-translocating ferredoxin:NAD(+) oxidoreductase complex subunit G [Schaedlerella arabinosiphila]NDO71458.1 RnfABCDGE type electron transport complex subunit G [Schaedlerella arabinosiphila]